MEYEQVGRGKKIEKVTREPSKRAGSGVPRGLLCGGRKAEYPAYFRLRMEDGEFRTPYCLRLC